MKQLAKFLVIFSIFIGSFATPIQMSFQSSTTQPNESGHFLSDISKLRIETSVAYALSDPPKNDPDNYFGCSWYNIACHLLNFVYIIAVPVGNALVAVAGMFLDFFLLHSISSDSYRSGFIEAGWEILRDVTNIFFLFALIMLAFKMVLGKGDKKNLINIILVALTINFSLFMSYMILDISNVFAHVFYNRITGSDAEVRELTDDNPAYSLGSSGSLGGESRSLAIADKIDPQELTKIAGNSTSSVLLKLLVVIIAGIINYSLIKVFLKVGLLMLGRTVGLFITIVLAPLAFSSIIVPQLSKVPYIGFESWIRDLIKLCFMAPVFLFFLYLTIQFVNIGLPGSAASASAHVITQILNIIVPMAAILVLIELSKKVATDMAGKIGGMVANKVASTVSTIGKVALGGAAIAATAGMGAAALAGRGIGAGASALGRKTGSQTLSKIGKRSSSIGNTLRTTKVDLTKVPGFKKVVGDKMTSNISKVTGKSSFGRTEAAREWIKKGPISSTAKEDMEARMKRKKDSEKGKRDAEEYGSKFNQAETEGREEHEKWQEQDDVERATRAGERARKEAEKEKEKELSDAMSDANSEWQKINDTQKAAFQGTTNELKEVQKSIGKVNEKYQEAIKERAVDSNAQKTAEKNLEAIMKKVGKEPQAPTGKNATAANQAKFQKEHDEWEQRKSAHQGEIKDLETKIDEKRKAVQEADKKIHDLRTERDGGTDSNGNQVEGLKGKKKSIEARQKNIAGNYADAVQKVEDLKAEMADLGDAAESKARNEYADNVSRGQAHKTQRQDKTANTIRDGEKPTGSVAEELKKVVKAINDDR